MRIGHVEFTWRPSKARTNLRDHHVSFEDAAHAFSDPLGAVYQDLTHPERNILIAQSKSTRLLYTVFVELEETVDDDGEPLTWIHIISARKATSHERKDYEKA